MKALIDDLADSKTGSALKERKQYEDLRDGISAIETRIKTHKAELKQKRDELELKLRLKRTGAEEENENALALVFQANEQLEKLNTDNKTDSKKMKAILKDLEVLEQRLKTIGKLMKEVGGQISEQDAKRLILKKLHDIANKELLRYLNAEKRALLAIVENLWDKYAVSSQALEEGRANTLLKLNSFLSGLGYLP